MNHSFSFHPGELAAQQRWKTEDQWTEARKEQLLWREIPTLFHQRLESAPFFFLATSDRAGRCDCSFKGGGPGLIRILEKSRFAFADFNGNGAFMSLGNILDNPRVGCLFIDFNDGARLRVNGNAEIIEGSEAEQLFAGADRVVVVSVEQVVPNCAAHIPSLIPVQDDDDNDQ